MSDLPERLRALHQEFGQAHDVLIEAADRIDELEVEVEQLAVDNAGLRGVYRASRHWDLP